MKIRSVEIHYFDIPLRQPFRISIGTMRAANDVLVRVETDAGLSGWGEACPFPPITGETQETNVAAARNLRDLLLGKDPLAIGAFLREAGRLINANPSIVAAFDMALHDIAGEGRRAAALSSSGRREDRHRDRYHGRPRFSGANGRAGRGFIAAGFRKIKVKVGQEPDSRPRPAASHPRSRGTGLRHLDRRQPGLVRAPGGRRPAKRMEEFEIEFVEQPVASWDIPGLREVRRQSPIPVMADESLFSPPDAIKLVRAEACDYFNIKLMKCGGIRNALKIAHIAESAGIPSMVGCMLETRLALTAAAHVMAAERNIVFADLDGHTSHAVDPIVGGFRLEGGTITLPDAPGLGVDVDPVFLRGLRKA